MSHSAYAATMQGMWFSHDDGQNWARLLTPTGGMYNETHCFSIAEDPRGNGDFLAGTGQGLYRYRKDSNHFEYIPSPMDSLQILQVAIHPNNADYIVCGTRPGEIFISEDGGLNWRRSPVKAATECWFINTTRVTSIHFDDHYEDTIWITIEIDGVFRSDDRGHSWTQLIEGLNDNDTHDLVFHGTPPNRQILCSTEDGAHRSTDEGKTWQPLDIPQAPWPYFRSLKQVGTNSKTVIASVGDKPSGEASVLLISEDFGETWVEAELDTPANSTFWCIATHPADLQLLYAVTIYGQIYKSTDGGHSWNKGKRELGEIRQIRWTPNK